MMNTTYDRALTFFAATINAPSDMPEPVLAEMVNGLSHDIAWIFEIDQETALADLRAKVSGESPHTDEPETPVAAN